MATRPSKPWDIAILEGVSAPTTTNNRVKLWSWTAHELGQYASTGGWDFGANAPRWNWFDTSLGTPGSANCLSCTQRDIKRYPTPAAGIAATVQTLLYSSPSYGYDKIVYNLRENGSFDDFATALGSSCWGGCGWGGYPGFGPVKSDPSSVTANVGGPAGTPSAVATSSNGAQGCAARGQIFGFKAGLGLIGPEVGLNWCQWKAISGGLILVAGGVLLVTGAALLVSGSKRGQQVLAAVGKVPVLGTAPQVAQKAGATVSKAPAPPAPKAPAKSPARRAYERRTPPKDTLNMSDRPMINGRPYRDKGLDEAKERASFRAEGFPGD